MVIFRPHVEQLDPSIVPFYVTLVIHDLLLHNFMLDSGASHNLMPLAVVEKMGLEITKPYKDLYSFGSKRVKCLGMIKDFVVNLAQIPMKSVVMDIVVVDIPPRFGMLLSRSWGSKVGGAIKLDLTYATIPTFRGEQRRLYRESKFVKIMTPAKRSENSPAHGKESDLSYLFLEEDENLLEEASLQLTRHLEYQHLNENEVWKLYYDGENSKEGNGAGILLVSPEGSVIPFSLNMEFEATIDVVEYKALLLGLQTTKKMDIECLTVYGDFELVVRQIRNQFQVKHPRLRTYRNEVWDLIDKLLLENYILHSYRTQQILHKYKHRKCIKQERHKYMWFIQFGLRPQRNSQSFLLYYPAN